MRKLPLHDAHLDLGGRMAEREGWSLPLEFGGVLQEYRAHETGSVIWDVSNLGCIRVAGPGAVDLLQVSCSADLGHLAVGRSQYTFLLREHDASVIDDLMIWRIAETEYYLSPNACEEVVAALRRGGQGRRLSCEIDDLTEMRALLAVQGRRAGELVAQMFPDCADMRPFTVHAIAIDGHTGFITTTRFGRRIGFELHVPLDGAATVYRRIIDLGARPAGLGMRELHRVEVGIPRREAEMQPPITPLELGCAAQVAFDTEFVGRAALLERQRVGIDRRIRGVVMRNRRIPQPGLTLLVAGDRVGVVTSGIYSPRLDRGFALAFVHTSVELGDAVRLEGDNEASGRIVAVPLGSDAL